MNPVTDAETVMEPSTSTNVASDEQHTFVVENLEGRIRDSSKFTRISSIDSKIPNHSMNDNLAPDPNVLANLEDYARAISTDINNLLSELRNSLSGMTDATVKAVECFTDSISTSCDTVDTTIKSTYALLAKVEEFNKSMAAIRELSQKIKSIKHAVDLFETQLVTGSLK
ncbi:unnamed protein product [Thelazia callipaeda]|uniref:BORCS6 domain-containing protein n=1 Tax=Thelazia callipaeda TaxID=103827 RepID=A0A0N5D3L4_THECL|nr:unnamed protein product [Thelazia callipaeda]